MFGEKKSECAEKKNYILFSIIFKSVYLAIIFLDPIFLLPNSRHIFEDQQINAPIALASSESRLKEDVTKKKNPFGGSKSAIDDDE